MSSKLACPQCGYEVDAHSHVGPGIHVPSKGDVSICFGCAGWNKFDADLNLIEFTEEDKSNSEPEIIAQMEQVSLKIKEIKKNGRTN